MKRLLTVAIFFSILVIAGLVQQNHALAEGDASSSAVAKKYSIVFPISALGNCGSLAECKAYCDDSTHTAACVAFAKSKGFYHEASQSASLKNQTLLDAQKELGCSTIDQCRAFCSDPANQDKCQAFAAEHHLQPPSSPNSTQQLLLEKAKVFLGCDSMAACKALCSDPANKDKCMAFARSIGLSKENGQGPQEGSDSGKPHPSGNSPDHSGPPFGKLSSLGPRPSGDQPIPFGSGLQPPTGPGGPLPSGQNFDDINHVPSPAVQGASTTRNGFVAFFAHLFSFFH